MSFWVDYYENNFQLVLLPPKTSKYSKKYWKVCGSIWNVILPFFVKLDRPYIVVKRN